MNEEHLKLVTEIAADCGVLSETGRRLSELTSLGLGGEIRLLLRPRTIASLSSLLRELHRGGIPFRTLGGGANIAGGPGPFEEPVILTRTLKQEPEFEGTTVRAGGGFNIKRLVRACVARNLAGLEWAEGIPGTVGGALVTNAGSYGSEFGQSVTEAAWLAEDGSIRRRRLGPADFSYRESPLRDEGIVVEGLFTLREDEAEAVRGRMRAFQARRIQSQPPGERSAGCIFKNPPGDSAGRIIDASGLKGLSVGGVVVSEVHANFIVNRGDATSEDLFRLIDMIKENVLRESGIELMEEVVRWK